MTSTNSLSNSLNSSGGTFNSNSSLNSTPSADRYAALKDLDEQLREAKTVDTTPTPTTEPAGKKFQFIFVGKSLEKKFFRNSSRKSIQESIPSTTAAATTIVSKLDHSRDAVTVAIQRFRLAA
jgi:hypothetical protein